MGLWLVKCYLPIYFFLQEDRLHIDFTMKGVRTSQSSLWTRCVLPCCEQLSTTEITVSHPASPSVQGMLHRIKAWPSKMVILQQLKASRSVEVGGCFWTTFELYLDNNDHQEDWSEKTCKNSQTIGMRMKRSSSPVSNLCRLGTLDSTQKPSPLCSWTTTSILSEDTERVTIRLM